VGEKLGAVPLTDGEIGLLAERLLPLVVEGLVWLAEEGSEVAGFLLAVPDANEIIQPLRGRMLSPGLLKALPYLVGWRETRLFRVIALGTRREFRGRGIESVMFAETLRKARQLGFVGCEGSWILEDNVPVRRLLEAFSAVPYKTYRVYARAVRGARLKRVCSAWAAGKSTAAAASPPARRQRSGRGCRPSKTGS
jgi:GNAT superfamily N-acetyltransferase